MAGAHGKLTDNEGGVTRLWKLKHPETYLKSAGTPASLGGVHRVAQADLAFEFMLNRLRLMEPFTADDFRRYTSLDPALLDPGLTRARGLGLLDETPAGWQVSSRGQAYLNDLQALFLPGTRVKA